jgi:Predicted nucleoside-diphosphate-sugar epimerases
MNIVLTGALGHIGKPLTQTLIAKGHSVTVISSNAGRQHGIEALGATAAIGSVADVAFLVSAFRNADSVYCMIPPNYSEPDQIGYYERTGSNYATAIRHSGVKRVVDLSSYGAHLEKGTGVITGSNRVERALNAIPGISLTHIRPGYFYYNLLPFIGMIRQAGFIGSVYGDDDRLFLVSPDDIADALAEEITTPDSSNKVRYVVSDERTCRETAQILGAAIGIPDLQWKTLPEAKVLASLLGNGIPEGTARSLVELGAAIHSGILQEDYERNKPVAMGKVKLTDFAKEFAMAYRNSESKTT